MRQPLTLNQARDLRPSTVCQCLDALNSLAGILDDYENLPGEWNVRGMVTRALAQVEADKLLGAAAVKIAAE